MVRRKKVRIGGGLNARKNLAYLHDLFEAGKVKPVIDGPYTLSEAPEALRYFGEGRHRGKVVMTVMDDVIFAGRTGPAI